MVASTTLAQSQQTTKSRDIVTRIHSRKGIFLFCNREQCHMTLTFELDLDNVNEDQHARYLGHRSLRHSSKVIVRTHRRTHTRDRLLCLDH